MSKYISCTAASVLPGSKRFPDLRERPRIKAWRCDLTALSRSHNFYFVACNDTIHVYQPRFPDQWIPGEPDLTLHPPISSPHLEPGIDCEDSHSITRLHVDYLGQDEIILVTCDDGDVIGYRTDEIQRVFDLRAKSSEDEQEIQFEDSVRTFLHRNVGASAWGLAIHREARMIAISANTHKVTVIAYALAKIVESSDESFGSSDSELEECDGVENQMDFPSPRQQDHVITLSARHNVPAVSFNNNGDNSSGRWLSSSSINGEALIWDLHQPKEPARVIRIGLCASVKDPTQAPKLSPGGCACIRPGNFPHAVWSTMFLDASIAYEKPFSEYSRLQSQHLAPCFYDVSRCKTRFSIRQRKFSPAPIVPPNNAISDEELSEMDVSETESDVSSTESHSLPLQESDETAHPLQPGETGAIFTAEVNNTEIVELPQTTSQPLQETSHSHTDISDTNAGPIPIADSMSTWGSAQQALPLAPPPPPPGPSNVINAFGVWFQPPGQTTATIVWDDDDDSDTDDEMFIPSIAQAHMALANAVRPMRAYCEFATSPSFEKQPQMSSPFLVITKEDIYLCQRPLDYSGDYSDPIDVIRRPLHPVERDSPWPLISGSHDRHCYTTQIPELGVFIVASPNGRAGVFSLTKTKLETQARPLYSFELEYVLPFANDDENKVCDIDGAKLIGVATGPVQGMLDKPNEHSAGSEDAMIGNSQPSNRRWRLLMYFADHTVLAFELQKRKVSEMPEVDELIV